MVRPRKGRAPQFRCIPGVERGKILILNAEMCDLLVAVLRGRGDVDAHVRLALAGQLDPTLGGVDAAAAER